jgi:hypothetical protein
MFPQEQLHFFENQFLLLDEAVVVSIGNGHDFGMRNVAAELLDAVQVPGLLEGSKNATICAC